MPLVCMRVVLFLVKPLWVKPSGQINTTERLIPSLPPSPKWHGGRGTEKPQQLGKKEGRKNETRDATAITHRLPWVDRCPARSLQKMANPSKAPSFCFYSWAWRCVAGNFSLVSLGHLSGCVPSQPIVQPHVYSLGGCRVRNREGIDAVQTLLSTS